ncbi:histone deacetylase [Moraxella nasovis]|uniref:histone deacetylase family protein n=1 Tax=Moraxella nasovis TaxID=2904121 RepID=UPI001F6220C9|nr:histone deacetylase [Moraxella nasovis]UNU73699.1 histone deacetylase [Moraxella nasovis]
MLKIAHSPLFCHPLPMGHRFPMAKYDLIPKKLINDGVIRADNLFHPQMLSESEILSTHSNDYWHKLKTGTLSDKEIRKIGLPMSAQLVKRERYITHATYECALYALQYGISLSTSGGTHHGFADHGEGFCVFNDVCVASNLLLQRGQARQILSVDLDVHQGNGNASIMANNPSVFIFSMHGKKNYPFIKPPSDLDIELADGTGDDEYLQILTDTLPNLIKQTNPDIIFYQAGVDVLATDKLGKLSLTMAGCHERDEIVLTTAYQFGVPVVVVMGGGYSDDVNVVVDGHCGVFRVASGLVG